jgi:predicted nucleotidyltransferase component of viral defense system
MIPEAAVKAEARRLGVDPLVVDRDHALGVVLFSMVRAGLDDWGWVFKGGTCLRKTCFSSYRFSEDLDFTCTRPLDRDQLVGRISGLERYATPLGVRLLDGAVRVELKQGEGGRCWEVRLPFRGAVHRTGRAANFRLHLSMDERLFFGVARRALLHPYGDEDEIACELPCYQLEEMLSEKLRAVSGQRRFAIARDVYDIWRLTTGPTKMTAHQVQEAVLSLPAKAMQVSLDLGDAVQRLDARRLEYRASWNSSVAPLAFDVPRDGFDQAWSATRALVERATT